MIYTFDLAEIGNARPPPSDQNVATVSPALHSKLVERARVALAQHLGPIAVVLVKQSAAAHTNEREFVESLAARLTDADARDDFTTQMQFALKAPD